MKLPRLAFVLVLYIAVHPSFADDAKKDTTGVETNAAGGQRMLTAMSEMTQSANQGGYGGGGAYGSAYGPGYVQGSVSTGQYNQPRYQRPPAYVPSILPQPVIPAIPIPGDGYSNGGVISQQSGYSSYSGYPVSNQPQAMTVFGNIPITVSGTINLGVRGQIAVQPQGGGSGGGYSSYGYQNSGTNTGTYGPAGSGPYGYGTGLGRTGQIISPYSPSQVYGGAATTPYGPGPAYPPSNIQQQYQRMNEVMARALGDEPETKKSK